MAITGTISIYRLTDPGDSETDVTDKVDFGGTSPVPDSLSEIQTIKPIMSIIGQENQSPDSKNPNPIDETGIAIIGLEITGILRANESTKPGATRVFRDWFKDDQKTNDYPEGRIGFRNNLNNEFNLNPSTSSGYVLEEYEVEQNYSNGDFRFFIKLRFQGDFTDLNST